jgi:hypothetical protein
VRTFSFVPGRSEKSPRKTSFLLFNSIGNIDWGIRNRAAEFSDGNQDIFRIALSSPGNKHIPTLDKSEAFS